MVLRDTITIDPEKLISREEAIVLANKCECKGTIAVEFDLEEWLEEYDLLSKDPPKNGDIITTCDGSPVRIDVEYAVGKSPFMYASVYVPSEVGAKLAWYAQGKTAQHIYGLKAILKPRSRDLMIRRFGIRTNPIYVNAIRIDRFSDSGRSILVDIPEE